MNQSLEQNPTILQLTSYGGEYSSPEGYLQAQLYTLNICLPNTKCTHSTTWELVVPSNQLSGYAVVTAITLRPKSKCTKNKYFSIFPVNSVFFFFLFFGVLISLGEDKEERNIISQNSGSSLEMSLFPCTSIEADSVPGQMKGWSLIPPWGKNGIQKSQLRMWVCLKMIHKASDLICVQITTTSSSHLPITVFPSDKEKFLFNFPEHHSFMH